MFILTGYILITSCFSYCEIEVDMRIISKIVTINKRRVKIKASKVIIKTKFPVEYSTNI